MKVALVHVFPTVNAVRYIPMAKRFVSTYLTHPPGKTEHELYVAVNGSSELGGMCQEFYQPLKPKFFQHNNYGKDIGAYMAAADIIPCDLMVCMGTPVHFHRQGWLDRMVEAYLTHGPAMYGCWGFHSPTPHLRTTVFWIPPDLLLAYPHRVSDGMRYSFEHSPSSITLWSQQQGFEPRQVTWNHEYEMQSWQPISLEDSLVIDQHISGDR